MADDSSEQPAEANGGPGREPELNAGYDHYRSLADPHLVIFVPACTIPPLRFKAGGWVLLQSSVDLDSDARTRIAESGYLIETVGTTSSDEQARNDHAAQIAPSQTVELTSEARAQAPDKGRSVEAVNPISSGEHVPSVRLERETPSLEIEFALVIARMINSVKSNPEDMRKAVYELARQKLQEQLLHAGVEEKMQTRRALEVAIRSVETFSEKHADIRASGQRLQLNGPPAALTGRELSAASESDPGIESRFALRSESNTRYAAHQSTPWSYVKRTVAVIAVVGAITVILQHRESLLFMAHLLQGRDGTAAVEQRSAPSQVSVPVVTAPPLKPTALLPTDYGVYAVIDDALIPLSRVANGAPVMKPSQAVLPNGHPKFIVYSNDLASSVGDRVEVRISAKVAREFSANAAGKRPVEDVWIIRNISLPYRASPVKDNPAMNELHSEDPALELTPGRYALILKNNQAYDFSVAGNTDDPRHCIERIVGPAGVFFASCKSP